MTPPPDKVRPWRRETCRHLDCEFSSMAEFEWLRHMAENPGHEIGPTGIPVAVKAAPADVFPFEREREQ